ncbi:speE, partial [Acrasis kona]
MEVPVCTTVYEDSCYEYKYEVICADYDLYRFHYMFPVPYCGVPPFFEPLVRNLTFNLIEVDTTSTFTSKISIVERDTILYSNVTQRWRQMAFGDVEIEGGAIQGKRMLQSPSSQIFSKGKRFTYSNVMIAASITNLRTSRKQANIEPNQTTSVLIGGMGVGALPIFFHDYFPDYKVDVIEIDPSVIRMAEKHFGYNASKSRLTKTQDVKQFLEETTNKYDIIMIDAFNEDGAPPGLFDQHFSDVLHHRLLDSGVLVVNTFLYKNANEPTEVWNLFRSNWSEVDVLSSLENSGNKIVVCQKKHVDTNSVLDSAREVDNEQVEDYGFSAYNIMSYGLSNAE